MGTMCVFHAQRLGGTLDSKNYIVSGATTNTFTVAFDSSSLGSFAGLATAEKVVTVSSITKADYAIVVTHGDHGFTNDTHINDYVAFFDLKLATELNNKKYRIKYIVDDTTIVLDWNSTGISQAESCSDATCGVIRLATEDLDVAVSAGDMKTALQGLDGFGTMSVSRAKDAESPSWTGGYMWLITFESFPGDIGKMLIATQQMTGVGAIVTVGDANDNPLQSGSERDANQIGGTFVVKTHDGNRTADLPYGITKEDMQDALNSILGANSVLVTRNAPGQSGDNVANIGPAGGYVWHVEFSHSRVGGDVPMLLVEANNITGIGTSLVVTEDVKGNELTGTFQLASWDGSPDQTGELLYYSTASQVENRWNLLEVLATLKFLLQSQSLKSMDTPGWLHSIRTIILEQIQQRLGLVLRRKFQEYRNLGA